MIFKQRFEHGRTNFKDIGSDFMIVTRASDEFQDIVNKHFHDGTDKKDIHAFLLYGEREIEPLYIDFQQWIYTNDGQMFLNLTTRQITGGEVINKPNLNEVNEMLQKMNYYHKENGFMAVTGGVYTFFEDKPTSLESVPITKEWLLKLVREV